MGLILIIYAMENSSISGRAYLADISGRYHGANGFHHRGLIGRHGQGEDRNCSGLAALGSGHWRLLARVVEGAERIG